MFSTLSFRSRSFLVGGLLALATLVPAAGQSASSPSLRPSLHSVDSLRMEGQFRRALDQLDRLSTASAPSVDVLWRRALLLSDLGRKMRPSEKTVALHRRAYRVADSARAVDPTDAWAHLVTALAAGRLTLHVGPSKRVKYSRAVKRHTDRAIALDSTLAPAYHLRGRWHREVADLNFFTRTLVRAIYGGLPDASYEASIRDFQRSISLQSTPYNHLELAKTYLELDRNEAARTHLHRALESTGSPFQHEHWSEARALLEKLN